VLLLGPVVVSVILVALYVAGLLDVDWPVLLIGIVLLNVAGDLAYALRDERRVKQGGAGLRNAITGREAVATQAFTACGGSYQGRVRLAGELWRARSARPLRVGTPVTVTGRRGLVLDVEPVAAATAAADDEQT